MVKIYTLCALFMMLVMGNVVHGAAAQAMLEKNARSVISSVARSLGLFAFSGRTLLVGAAATATAGAAAHRLFTGWHSAPAPSDECQNVDPNLLKEAQSMVRDGMVRDAVGLRTERLNAVGASNAVHAVDPLLAPPAYVEVRSPHESSSNTHDKRIMCESSVQTDVTMLDDASDYLNREEETKERARIENQPDGPVEVMADYDQPVVLLDVSSAQPENVARTTSTPAPSVAESAQGLARLPTPAPTSPVSSASPVLAEPVSGSAVEPTLAPTPLPALAAAKINASNQYDSMAKGLQSAKEIIDGIEQACLKDQGQPTVSTKLARTAAMDVQRLTIQATIAPLSSIQGQERRNHPLIIEAEALLKRLDNIVFKPAETTVAYAGTGLATSSRGAH